MTACQPQEHVLLLDLYSQRELSEVTVRVLSLDTPRTPHVENRRLPEPRTPAELREDPARVAVVLEAPAQILVHIVGLTPAGETVVATRCYSLNGVIEDDVMLVGPLGALDADGDTFVADPAVACREPTPDGAERACDDLDYTCASDRASDCDDATATIYPGAPFICQNGIDEDCDGSDEPCGDQDGDGFEACAETPTPGCDCDDTNPQINPGALEAVTDADVCLDGIDQNCDGVDACCDLDRDGFTRCGMARPNEEDCVDSEDQCPAGMTCVAASINPGASEVPLPGEECDQIDNDCNGLIDDSDACRGPDFDGDGSPHCGLAGVTPPCDCNDCDSGIGPGARDVCGNGVDEDCSGSDEVCDPGDADGDGQLPPGDCNDADPFARAHSPGEPVFDLCADTIAATCVPGEFRDCSEDTDGDGYVEPAGCEGDAAVGPLIAEACNGVDDNCDGNVDEVLDPAGMTGCAQVMALSFFADDRTNCGGCRIECPTGITDVCDAGVCDCSTEAGAPGACVDDPINAVAATTPQCCGDGCVDLDDDPNNCGGCGRACGQGEVCSGGFCTCGTTTGAAVGDHACPDAGDESSVCCGSGASAACRDVTMDDGNCGQCGLVCGDHSSCQARFCACDAPAGGEEWLDCNGNRFMFGNDGCEVNVRSDDLHCGRCDNACNLTQADSTCTAGVCRITMCRGTFEDCDMLDGSGCEANLTAAVTCGACSSRCGTGETCSSMACTCGPDSGSVGGGERCLGGEPDCCPSNGGCTDLADTLNNCGACGATCGTNETCGTRRCSCGGVPGTPGAGAVCTGSNPNCCPGSGNCVNLTNDEGNCGACAVSCGVGETCVGTGQCDCGPTSPGAMGAGARCVGGTPNCCGAAGCVNLTTDESHCGSCSASCGPAETCQAPGQCTCGSGDVGSTGGGRVCTVAESCCASGDGCVNFNTDEGNCGGCGVMCGAAETCGSGGVCSCGPDDGSAGGGAVCGAGDTCCPGGAATDGCVDIETDELHCGGCGVQCGAGESCVAGVCECDTDTGTRGSGAACGGGTTCCPSTGCESLGSDTSNCGACGVSCGASETCSSGRCRCGTLPGTAVGSGAVCSGAAPTCCAASNACANLDTDESHCGACGVSCGTAGTGTESCGGGLCSCGDTNGTVGGGSPCGGSTLCCAGTPDACNGSC